MLRGGWLKDGVLPLAVILLELCWLAPWSWLLAAGLGLAPGQAVLSPGALLGLLVGSRWLLRLAIERRWSLRAARWLLLGSGLLAVLLAIRFDYYSDWPLLTVDWLADLAVRLRFALVIFSAPIAALAIGLAVWGRGAGLARGELDDLEVLGRFRFGLGALLLFLVGAGLMVRPVERVIEPAGGYLLGAVFIGLIALSLARLETIRDQGRQRQLRLPAINRHWLLLLLGVVAGLLGLTLLVGQLFSVDLLGRLIVPLLLRLVAFMQIIITLIALPIALLLSWLIDQLLQVLAARLPPPPRLAGQPMEPVDLTWLRSWMAANPNLVELIQWGIMLLIVAGGLAVLARVIFWWSARRPVGEGNEERDSVWHWGVLTTLLRAWWTAWWGRRRRRPVGPESVVEVAGAARPGPAVRAIYRQVLARGELAGRPRGRATTPDEHLSALQQRLAPAAALARITAAYVAVRYGDYRPTAEQLAAVADDWQSVQQSAAANGGETADRPGHTPPA